MPLPSLGPLSSEDVAEFLREYGFTANPAGLITHYQGDLTYESDSLAYLDINAIAVRERDSVPDRRLVRIARYSGTHRETRLFRIFCELVTDSLCY